MHPDPEPPTPEPDLSDKCAARLIQDAISDLKDTAARTGEWEPPLPEELAPLMPGYSITRILGRGGMGAVYHGVQINLDREVAIKLLPPELGQNPEFEARFKREAKSMAQLNHPNIVQIFDFGETTAGHHFITMEYVDGTDLQQLIHTGELESEGALNAISQICDALEYAHSEGFVHRDIKPANMFINRKGVLKVGDFGLARLVEDEASLSAAERMGLTMTGVAMGTPHYIAPEQLEKGSHVDQRADIFSLGIMFYEMLTGEIPRGVIKSPSKKSKSLDVRIDGVVFKAMDANPGDRYQTATDFRADVDAIRNTPEQTGSQATTGEGCDESSPISEKQSPKPLSLAAMIILPVLLLGAVVFIIEKHGGTESTESTPAAPLVSSSPGYQVPVKPLAAGPLHGLVYDKTLKKVVPLWIPAGWKTKRFTSVGATKSDGHTATTAFSWWAITDEDQLFSQYDRHQMTGIARQSGKVLNYHHKVGVTRQGTLFSGPDFFPPPAGADFIDAQWGNGFAIALTSNGEAKLWKRKNFTGNFLEPRSDLLKNVEAISAENQTAIFLSATGKVTHWHIEKGVIQKELTEDKDIVAISSMVSLSRDGKVHSIGYSDLEFTEKAVDLDYGGELLALKFESGDWRIFQRSDSRSESSEALISAFESTKKDRVIDLFVDATGGQESAIAIWLEEESSAEDGSLPEAKFASQSAGTSASPLIQSATRENPYINSIGMQFVPIPITGGPRDGQKILFSAWETRVSDYRAFFKAEPQDEWREADFAETDEHPAVCIPIADAIAFCDWLTREDRKNGRLVSNEYYRLPTDHEWSCAAGIGHLEDPSTTPESKECRIPNLYYWGSELPPPNGFGNFYGNETKANPAMTPKNTPRKPLPGFEDAFAKTAPVGSFAPNGYGIYDLEGNAFEWCDDWYSTQKEKKVLRGGSWGVSLAHTLLTSSRISNSPAIRFDSHGFRCVLAVAEE